MLRSLRNQGDGADQDFSKVLRKQFETALDGEGDGKSAAPAYSSEVEAALQALREGKLPTAAE